MELDVAWGAEQSSAWEQGITAKGADHLLLCPWAGSATAVKDSNQQEGNARMVGNW